MTEVGYGEEVNNAASGHVSWSQGNVISCCIRDAVTGETDNVTAADGDTTPYRTVPWFKSDFSVSDTDTPGRGLSYASDHHRILVHYFVHSIPYMDRSCKLPEPLHYCSSCVWQCWEWSFIWEFISKSQIVRQKLICKSNQNHWLSSDINQNHAENDLNRKSEHNNINHILLQNVSVLSLSAGMPWCLFLPAPVFRSIRPLICCTVYKMLPSPQDTLQR